MTRLLDKGGASAESLYELTNGYINASRRATHRPGTTLETASLGGTKGLCVFKGAFVVFSHQVTPMSDSRFTCEVLTHPTDPNQPLADIHFAEPFLGHLYVSAEFADGSVYHYWLQVAETWAAGSNYKVGDLVQPSVPNGYAYRATRSGDAPLTWAPDVARAVNDVVVPTVDNGFDYIVTSVIGDAPRSGSTEPNWPEADGATVFEDTGREPPTPPSGDGSGQTLPSDVEDRYGSGSGSGGSGGRFVRL